MNDNLFKALSIYIDAMRPFTVSILSKYFPNEPWEDVFFARLKPEKQEAWKRNARSLNEESSRLVLIDYNNLTSFAIAFKQELAAELGNVKDANRLVGYYQELQETRNKCSHYQALDDDEVERAFSNMKFTARLLEMDELTAELEHVRNKTSSSAPRSTVADTQTGIAVGASVYPQPPRPFSESTTLPAWFTNAIPHYDVRNGNLDESVFAANLAEVALGFGQEIYCNSAAFFEKTYVTAGMRVIANRVVRALNGEDTDNRVVSLQTGFGGGKTHTLILLYHIAKAGNALLSSPHTRAILSENLIPDFSDARVAVFTNNTTDVLQGRDIGEGIVIQTLWGELAWQLGGLAGYEKIRENDKQRIAPTAHLIKLLFAEAAPCLILLDELADYCVKASGIAVGNGTLADQTIAFIQTLTEVTASVPRCVLIATLPASASEVAASNIGQDILTALQRRIARVGTDIKPVEDEEIFEVVRRRLFEEIRDESAIEQVLARYKSTYQNRRSDLPDYAARLAYIDKMRKSYPFHPELIDMFRLRWGQDPRFQRTRGVLRLLASVIRDLWSRRHALTGTQALIHTADVNLINLPAVTATITGLMGSQWETVMHADVYGTGSNAYRIDNADLSGNPGKYNLTQGVAATILMASMGNLQNKGLTVNELKLCVLKPDAFNHNDVNGVLSKMEEVAHYLYSTSGQHRSYWFQTKPNINILVNQAKSEINATDIHAEIINRLTEQSRNLLRMKALVNPSNDIPEQKGLTLIILGPEYAAKASELNESLRRHIEKIALYKGTTNRVYRNTLLYLACSETGISMLQTKLSEYLACVKIQQEYSGQIEAEQRGELIKRRDDCNRQADDQLIKAYHVVLKYTAKTGLGVIEMRSFGSDFSAHLNKNLMDELEAEEWIINGVGVNTLRSANLYPAIDRPVQLTELYEAFLRFDDKPMISSSLAIVQSVQKYCANGEFNIAYGRAGDYTRIYCREPVASLEVDDPQYWLVDRSIQNMPTREPLSPGATADASAGADTTTHDKSLCETREPYLPGEHVRKFQSIRVTGKIPAERWTDLFSGFVVPLKNNGLEIEVSFRAKTNNLNPLDESARIYKVVKESALQLGLELEVEEEYYSEK